MGYPTDAITFPQAGPGEHPSALANLLGAEITAIETGTLHASSQTLAKMRLRAVGNQFEWGPAGAGQFSVLGNTQAKSFVGLGCVAAPTAGQFRTGAQPGIVLTHNGASGLLVQSVPLPGVNNQTPVTRLTVLNNGIPTLSNPVIGSYGNNSLSVVGNTGAYVAVTYPSVLDPYGFYQANPTGDFVVPAGLQGVYLWVAMVNWQSNATGNRFLRLVHIPTGFSYGDWRICDADGGVFTHTVSMVRNMVAGERINLQLMQTSGVTLVTSLALRMVKLA